MTAGKILILDGRQRSTLAAVRSIGQKGLHVVVGEDSFPCLASRSKYCRGTFKYTSVAKNPTQFAADILAEISRTHYDMILPMIDTTTQVLVGIGDKIALHSNMPAVGKETYYRTIDKGYVVKLANELGLSIPKTYFLNSISDIDAIQSELKFPIVIKPRQSKYLIEEHWVDCSVDYANSLDDLRAKLERFNKSLPLPILQERIHGPGEGTFVLYNNGKLKSIFFHRRLREKPLSGGVSVLRESIPIDSAMKEYSDKLLSALNWHGVAMVEFKLDERDNRPKIMEINTRFWGSLQLAIDSGIDFPYMLYRMIIDGDIHDKLDYKVGVQSRWEMGDVDHLLARLFKSDKALRLPKNFPGRFKTMYEFMKFYKSNMKYEVFRLSDPGPFFHEFAVWLKDLL
jgi:predicted ATP-grasp superfamily ATP-dependent carboligase